MNVTERFLKYVSFDTRSDENSNTCPNLSTGGENAHSIHEFIPVSALQKMVDVIIKLVSLTA